MHFEHIFYVFILLKALIVCWYRVCCWVGARVTAGVNLFKWLKMLQGLKTHPALDSINI